MIRRVSLRWAAIALLIFSGIGCSKAIKLSLKFNAGDEYKYSLIQEATTSTEFMGKKMEMPSITEIALTQKVEKVDQETAELNITYDSYTMEMNIGGKKIPSTMGKSMVGKTNTMKISSNGEVIEPKSTKAVMGIQGVGNDPRNIFLNLYPKFPEKKLKVGDSWTQTQEMPQSQMEMLIEYQYTLSKLEKKKGYDCAVIDYTVSMKVKGGDPEKTTNLKGSGEGKGTTYFAYDKGLLVDSQIDIEFTMSISAPLPTGKQEIPTSTHQNIKLSLI